MNSCAFSKRNANKLLMESYNTSFDMIIVPGIPFDTTSKDSTMRGRIYWSKYLYDKGIAKNVMYSGSSVYNPYNEAEIMAMYAEALGIPKENIFTETKAEHSTENIYYSYKKARKLGFKSIAVASDPFQTRMLKRFTKRNVDPQVKLLPLVHDTMVAFGASKNLPRIDFNKAYRKDFISIEKRESKWKRFKGTLGYNIDEKAYD